MNSHMGRVVDTKAKTSIRVGGEILKEVRYNGTGPYPIEFLKSCLSSEINFTVWKKSNGLDTTLKEKYIFGGGLSMTE